MLDNVKTPHDLNEYIINNIKYGFISKNKKIYIREKGINDLEYEDNLFHNYYLQTPEELLKNKVGICFDQVELSKYWFKKHNYKIYTYYTNFHNHVILIYKDKNTYNYFETSLKYNNGIHTFKSLNECLRFYFESQIEHNVKMIDEFRMYLYQDVSYGSDFDKLVENFKDNNFIILK